MNTHQLVTIVALHLGWRDPSFFHLNTSASVFTNRGKKTISLKSLELEHSYAVTSVTYGSPLSLNSEQLSASSDKSSQASCLRRTPAWNWLLRKQSCTLGLAGERKKRKKQRGEKPQHSLSFCFERRKKNVLLPAQRLRSKWAVSKAGDPLQNVVTKQWHLVAKR